MKFVDQYNENDLTDPSRDLPNVRLVELQNGKVVRLERKDPYGLITIGWFSGPAPRELSGAYTTFEYASKALTLYVNNNGLDTKAEEPEYKAPPLQYKKKYRDPETGENLRVA